MKTAHDILKKIFYPGRGIILGITPNGKNLAIAYFLTGRSDNSKNRILTFKKNKISAEPITKNIKNPSLIIYNPVAKFKQFIIISNGNHTETITKGLKNNLSFEETLRTRNFENDPPILTPRIAAIAKLNKNEKNCSYKLAIIKKATVPCSTERFFFEYPKPIQGQGHLIHTYRGKNKKDTKSFNQIPKLIKIPNQITSFFDEIWNSLDPENRISLFVEFLNLKTKKCIRKIANAKNKSQNERSFLK